MRRPAGQPDVTDQEVIRRSAEQLRLHVERHLGLLLSMTEQDLAAAEASFCPRLDCPHERKLRRTLIETIETLERTRKAFKSRQLETLRKKLIRALAEKA